MAEGYKDFVSAALASADLEDYCELQTTLRFTSAAARTTALSGVLIEGLRCFLKDLNVEQVYSGSAWSTIGPVHGALTSWTPTITQSGSVTCTVSRATYMRIGRQVDCQMYLSVTGAGTGANAVIIGGLPFTAVASNVVMTGSGFLLDSNTGFYNPWIAAAESTTTVALWASAASAATNPRLGVTGFTAALAAGDLIVGGFSFECASDG